MNFNTSRPRVLGLAVAVFVAIAASGLLKAQSATPEVEVAGVKFNNLRVGSGTMSWYEIDVELQAKPAAVGETRFVNRVKVALSLAVEIGSASGKRFEFYRSEVEFVALESGRANARFYLPPEVSKRDAIRGDAKHYAVELSVAGRELSLTRANFSTATLATSEALKSFQAKIASAAGANEGVMVPQYLTPFAFDGQRPAPSAVRKP